METKTLLTGIISFIAGALLVSVAATTFEKDRLAGNLGEEIHAPASLQKTTGDDFDKAFISEMIVHHQGAIEMAKLAGNQAKHPEIKQLSQEIIAAQEKEIGQMKQWQQDWGYEQSNGTRSH